MKIQKVIRLANHPCTGKIKEGRRTLICRDVYRIVTYTSKGKITRMRCLLHQHVVKGKQRLLVNGNGMLVVSPSLR